MTEKRAFDAWWSQPGEPFTDGEEIAQEAWRASRKRALEEFSAAARARGLMLVKTEHGLLLIPAADIKAQSTPTKGPTP